MQGLRGGVEEYAYSRQTLHRRLWNVLGFSHHYVYIVLVVLHVESTMVADLYLAGNGHQRKLGFSSSLALFNSSFKKGQPAHQEGFNLLQE